MLGNVGKHHGFDNRQHRFSACSAIDAAAGNISAHFALKVADADKQSGILVGNALQNPSIGFNGYKLSILSFDIQPYFFFNLSLNLNSDL